MSGPVTYRHDDSIAVITLDDGKANVLGLGMQQAINEALDQADRDNVGALVIACNQKVFSGGFDLKVFQSGDMAASVAMLKGGFELSHRLLSYPKPVVMAATGHAIAMGGYTDDGTLREVVIGNNVITIPANAIRFDRARHDGVASRLDLYLRYPALDGYSEAARSDFNGQGAARNIIFLSFEEQMMSRDMSGRFAPIYSSLIEQPGLSGPDGTRLFVALFQL